MANSTKNPFTWVEIYVDNMSRAQKFYESVFEIELNPIPMPDTFGDMQMLNFPWVEGEPNISGALVKMEDIKPGGGGTIAYFTCEDCEVEAKRVELFGGKILQPKMSIGEFGFCATFLDTEGNVVGLHSMS